MDINDGNSTQVTVVLGDEFDDALRAKLNEVLRQLGALPTGLSNRFVAGSQELEEFEVAVDGRKLHIEAETYIGLSIKGPNDLVQQVRSLMASP